MAKHSVSFVFRYFALSATDWSWPVVFVFDFFLIVSSRIGSLFVPRRPVKTDLLLLIDVSLAFTYNV